MGIKCLNAFKYLDLSCLPQYYLIGAFFIDEYVFCVYVCILPFNLFLTCRLFHFPAFLLVWMGEFFHLTSNQILFMSLSKLFSNISFNLFMFCLIDWKRNRNYAVRKDAVENRLRRKASVGIEKGDWKRKNRRGKEKKAKKTWFSLSMYHCWVVHFLSLIYKTGWPSATK